MTNNTRWSTVAGTDINAATSEEAIKLGGLDWEVKQSNVIYDVGEKLAEDTSKRVNFRSDTGASLGIVSDGYKVLQNSKAFAFTDSLIGYAEAMYTNVGSFKGGRYVYLQAKLPGSIQFDDEGQDVGDKLLTFITSHDGGLPVSVMFTPIRIVCQNTLNIAMRQSIMRNVVRHTANMMMSLKDVKENIGILNNQFTLLERLSRKMSKTPFRDGVIPQLVAKVGLIPMESDSQRANNIIAEVLERFHAGKGADLKSAKGTAWGAYNAVVEYVDHYRGSDAEKRAVSAVIGGGARVKERAFDLLSI